MVAFLRAVSVAWMATMLVACAGAQAIDGRRGVRMSGPADADSDQVSSISSDGSGPSDGPEADGGSRFARVLAVAAGHSFTCLLVEGGTVRCAGSNGVSMSAAREGPESHLPL